MKERLIKKGIKIALYCSTTIISASELKDFDKKAYLIYRFIDSVQNCFTGIEGQF